MTFWIGPRTSDSDLRPQTSDLGPRTSDVRRRTLDAGTRLALHGILRGRSSVFGHSARMVACATGKPTSEVRGPTSESLTRTCIRCESARPSYCVQSRELRPALRRGHASERGSRRVRRVVPYRGCTARTIRGGARSCVDPLPSSRREKILVLPPRAWPVL